MSQLKEGGLVGSGRREDGRCLSPGLGALRRSTPGIHTLPPSGIHTPAPTGIARPTLGSPPKKPASPSTRRGLTLGAASPRSVEQFGRTQQGPIGFGNEDVTAGPGVGQAPAGQGTLGDWLLKVGTPARGTRRAPARGGWPGSPTRSKAAQQSLLGFS